MRAKLQTLDDKVSTLHLETNQCQNVTHRTSKEMRAFKDQLAIVKDGISQLSDAMVDEFALVRREIKES